jgi:hypothetical protein
MQTFPRLALALAIAAIFALPAAAQHPAGIIAVHGINGTDLGLAKALPVDISLDGACAITDFRFGETTDPIPIDRGTYAIEVSLSDGACGGTVVISTKVKFGAGQVKAVVANLDLAGSPTATVVRVDNSELRDGFGRAYLVHAANAPEVDIAVSRGNRNRAANVTLRNGQADSLELSRGTWTARIFPTLSETRVAGPAGVPVVSNELLIVYAVGTFPDTFELLAQSFTTGPLE